MPNSHGNNLRQEYLKKKDYLHFLAPNDKSLKYFDNRNKKKSAFKMIVVEVAFFVNMY